MALLDEQRGEIGGRQPTNAGDGDFRRSAPAHPPAIRLERAIRDLYGLDPVGAVATCGRGSTSAAGTCMQPLERAPRGGAVRPRRIVFLPVEGENLHQIPVGPVHAGIIEPGHFRFTANGETVVRLEQRLGYVHKGIEALMAGATLDAAARLAGRTSGDSTVAYALAFARAVEAALGIEAPPRAVYLRALMAELERIANHLGDFGAICNDASFSIMHAQCGILRERRPARRRRLLRPPADDGPHRARRRRGRSRRRRRRAQLRALLEEIRRALPELVELYDNTASLQDRTVTHRHPQARAGATIRRGRLCRPRFGPRVRRAPDTRPIRPTTSCSSTCRCCSEGDVNARVWVRIREVEQSLGADRADPGRACRTGRSRAAVPTDGEAREGLALVEGFRGDVLVWLRIVAAAAIARCHLRDPSWFQWPLLEAAIEGNIVADFPLCNKSFNCSYSGHDL